MEIDRTKQSVANEKVKKLLQENEEQRAALRLEKCFRDLLNGNIETLNNDEIINNIPPFLYALYEDGQVDPVFKILHTLSNGSCDSNRPIRERSIMVISVFIGIVMQKQCVDFDETFSMILVRWLKEEQEFITGFEIICSQLQLLVKKVLDAGQWGKAENLLIVLYQIAAGILKKQEIIKKVVNRTLNQLATEELITRLLEVYLNPESDDQAVTESLLIHLGVKSISYLVKTLSLEEDAERRYLLLELLPNNDQVYTIMKEQLKEDVPWYVIRNAILIFSRESTEANFQFMREYIDYPDMRVQQQVISGIWKMGGKDMILRLLDILLYVDDGLKIQLINQLSQMKKEPVIGLGFVYVLRQRDKFARISRDELELALCRALADYPLAEVREVLAALLEESDNENSSTAVIAEAKNSLQKVKAVLDADDNRGDSERPEKDVSSSRARKERELDDLLRLDDDIDDEEFLSLDLNSDEDEDDLTLLADESEYSSDSIGDELLDEDDAFQVILAETRQNGTAMLQDDFELEEAQGHISVWSDFYDRLDSDEFTTFYALLQKKEFQPQQAVVAMGDNTRQLIFIDEGDLVPVFGEDDDRISVKNLQGGNIIGSASFFGERHWPFTLICQDVVRCHVLDKNRCQEFLDRFPAVYEKLKSYCKSHDVLSWLLEMLDNKEPLEEKVIIYDMYRKLGASLETTDDSPGDGLCYGAITGGVCIETEIENRDLCQELTAKLVEAVLCDADEKCTKVFGVITGWQTDDKEKNRVRILVQFYRPYRSRQFTCRSLTFL